MTLTPRQELVLGAVVEEFIASGSPVGSKLLFESHTFGIASSTIRNDLATLEELGLLDHPHTSAGRVPTDAGYRYYADAVMVVVITSAGRVTKRVFHVERAIDEGLADFARVYLNERLTGKQVGTRVVDSTFSSPELGAQERAFLAMLRPAFEVVVSEDSSLHLGGTARLLERLSEQGASHLNDIVALLEERYNLLQLLSEALRGPDLYLRIGREMDDPSLQACSLVAASYGVANRNLGTVSVLGPMRMDYHTAIAAVRGAAVTLSSLLEETW